MSISLPPKWCGVEHPHAMHEWIEPSGQTGFYRYCPGSLKPCGCESDTSVTPPGLGME